METSDKELPFLDILIKRNDDKIWTAIYFKPTDNHQCLEFSSSPPNHCKKNITFLLAWRKSTAKIRTSVRIKGKTRKSMNIPSI